LSTTDRTDPYSATELIRKHLIGDGYDIIFDLEKSHGVRLSLPDAGSGTADHWWVANQDIRAWNEHEIEVRIDHATREEFGDGFEIVLPPHSIHAIRWESP